MIAREDKGAMGIDYNRSPTVYIELGRENIATNTTKVKTIDEHDLGIGINSSPKTDSLKKISKQVKIRPKSSQLQFKQISSASHLKFQS